jgi:hypothetical protein
VKIRGWTAKESEFGSQYGTIFFFSMSSRPVLGVATVMSNGVQVIKWSKREATDHSPPTNAEVKNTWIYKSTHSYAFLE